MNTPDPNPESKTGPAGSLGGALGGDRGKVDRSSLDLLSDRVARGSRLRLWAEDAARWGLGVSAAVAGVLLVGRSVMGVDLAAAVGEGLGALPGRESVLSGCALMLGVGWLAAAAFTWWRSGQSAMGREDAALWLDLRSDASGRVVTANEVSEASAQPWRAQAVLVAKEAESVPSPRWGRLAQAAALGLALAFAATLVPVRTHHSGASDGITAVFEERLEDVADQLLVLDENVGLEEEELAELEASLERLEEAIQDDPNLEATFEAIDRLEDQLAARAEEALAEAKQALASLAEQQRAGSDSAASDGDPASAGAMPAGADLESLLSELALSESELAQAGLSKEALSELADVAAEDHSKLSPEELAELAEALASAMSEPLSALAQAGLLSESAASVSAFKSSGELPELTAEQLAMLEPAICPDCGKPPGEDCESSGEP